jgi:hypothetical protein
MLEKRLLMSPLTENHLARESKSCQRENWLIYFKNNKIFIGLKQTGTSVRRRGYNRDLDGISYKDKPR